MSGKKRFWSAVALTALVECTAAGDEMANLKAQIEVLEAKTDLLLEETAAMKSGVMYGVIDSQQTQAGLGDGASKVYYSRSPLSIGGYGEMYWASESRDGKDAYADVYRFVPYIGYRFSETVLFNAEIEIEHGGEKVVTEFMYLDFLLGDTFNVRVGHLLVPMGLVNLRHEPTLYGTVQRPEVEKYLIPSTWHENGVLVYGELPYASVSYSLGIVNALDFDNTDKGTSGWIRSGRTGAATKGTMQRVAFVGRMDYRGINGLMAGASLYYGDGAQGRPAGTTAYIGDLHAVYESGPVKLKGLYSLAGVDGAEKLGDNAAKNAEGFYVNAEYDVLSLGTSAQRLPIFVQYEHYDPTVETVHGDAKNGITNITAGLNYFPHGQVVLKLDLTRKAYSDSAREDYDIVSMGLGFVF